MGYEIVQKFISKNRSYKKLVAKGTVVHETASPNGSAEAHYKYFNDGAKGRSASAHAFIDHETIIQTVPWDEQSWHAGGTANRNYIGIELCHYEDEKKFNEIWKRAVWLFAYLHVNVIKQTTINKDTLMSHKEVSLKWKETTHVDPVAYFAIFGKTVDDFRNAAQAEINAMIAKPTSPSNATYTVEAGDTLWGISKKYDMTVDSLMKLNNLSSSTIHVGQILNITQQSAPTPEPIPQPKETGDADVLKLQRTLNRLKIRDGKGNALEEDGSYGRLTTEAVKRFQVIMGLDVDGKAGPATWSVLNAILDKPACSINKKPSVYVIKYIQYRVGAVADGLWGNNTNNAVKKFQSSAGLSVDGCVGPNTWKALIG
jgi:N-acetylmuramoyl-L-alanine amidase CwlA